MRLIRPLFGFSAFRKLLKRRVNPGPDASERAKTVTHVWGRVEDDQGQSVESWLHGPEAGVEWTVETALTAVSHVVAGDISPGFQTPAQAFGPDFVLEYEGVKRKDA